MNAIRVFVAVNLPETAGAEVRRRQRQLAIMPGGDAVRWVATEPVHVTLRFLGDIPADDTAAVSAALGRAAAGIGSFPLELQGLGCFPHPRAPRIIWIGLGETADRLQLLAAAVGRETAAWGKPENRAFQPHVTIGRIQPQHACAARRLAEALPGMEKATPVRWSVRRIELMQSRLLPGGPEYSVLATLPFAGGGS